MKGIKGVTVPVLFDLTNIQLANMVESATFKAPDADSLKLVLDTFDIVDAMNNTVKGMYDAYTKFEAQCQPIKVRFKIQNECIKLFRVYWALTDLGRGIVRKTKNLLESKKNKESTSTEYKFKDKETRVKEAMAEFNSMLGYSFLDSNIKVSIKLIDEERREAIMDRLVHNILKTYDIDSCLDVKEQRIVDLIDIEDRPSIRLETEDSAMDVYIASFTCDEYHNVNYYPVINVTRTLSRMASDVAFEDYKINKPCVLCGVDLNMAEERLNRNAYSSFRMGTLEDIDGSARCKAYVEFLELREKAMPSSLAGCDTDEKDKFISALILYTDAKAWLDALGEFAHAAGIALAVK